MEAAHERRHRTWSVRDMVARAIKALGHASTFFLLSLPFVVFSTCGGPQEEYTGYQALRGIPFSPGEWNLDPRQFPGFGHDWWVAGIMLVALLAIGTAVLGGVKGVLAGLGLAIAGSICVSQALAFFNPPPSGYQWSPEPATGGNFILLVYVGSVLTDLSWLSAKSWSVMRRARGKQLPSRGEWIALGLLSTAFLTVIAVLMVARTLLVLLTRRS